MKREGKSNSINNKFNENYSAEDGFEFMVWKAELYKELFSFWKSMEE